MNLSREIVSTICQRHLHVMFNSATKDLNNVIKNSAGQVRWCTTPDSQPGLCMETSKCPSMVNFLTNTDNVEMYAEYLRGYVCHMDSSKVCCPYSAISPPKKLDVSTERDNYRQTPRVERPRPNVPKESGRGLFRPHDTPYSAPGEPREGDKSSDSKHVLPVEDCGLVANSVKVTGGHDAELLEFPWMALLMYKTSELCRRICVFTSSYVSFSRFYISLLFSLRRKLDTQTFRADRRPLC